jgi:hypothetical protein
MEHSQALMMGETSLADVKHGHGTHFRDLSLSPLPGVILDHGEQSNWEGDTVTTHLGRITPASLTGASECYKGFQEQGPVATQ